jgi:MULE transposase domain
MGEIFQLVYNFKVELEMKCPGSIVEIECERDGTKMRFSKMFVALKPCIDGFLLGCRPYLGVDSTHLIGKYRGQLAAACGIDGHNWLFPIAYGVFDLETNENWKWFMTQLRKAIGDPVGLIISSDASKGLENVVAAVFPNAEHRECLRHLMENFKKRFHGDVYNKNMKPAAYAYTIEQCQIHLDAVKKESAEAIKYLKKYHKQLWSRSMFSKTSKCDYVTNNISECFNAWIKDLKDLHVVVS